MDVQTQWVTPSATDEDTWIFQWAQANQGDPKEAESDSSDSLYEGSASTVTESTLSLQSDDSMYAMAASLISDASCGRVDSTMVFKRGDRKGRCHGFVMLDEASLHCLVPLKVVEKSGHLDHMKVNNLPLLKGFAGEPKLPLGYVWLEFRINDNKKLFRAKFFVVEDSDISLSNGSRDFDALLGVKACRRVQRYNAILDAGHNTNAQHPIQVTTIG